MWTKTFLVLCCCFSFAAVSNASGLIEGLYCGKHNCYDVLQVDSSADTATIRRAYRKLAVQYHPDKYKGKDAHEKFQQIATAYEILKDEEERTNYDYMLENPDLVYRHYYNYYRRRVAPKVDVRVVIAATITIISVIQYLGWWHSYNSALKYALQMPRYRTKAKEIAKERGLLDGLRKKKIPKEDLKAEEEAILRSILEENLNVIGGYGKPSVWDVLWFKILFSPYHLARYVAWYVRWVWRFNIMKMEYGPEEKVYLTRRKLKLSAIKWEALPPEKQDELVEHQLWIAENYEQFQTEQQEEMKTKMAESNKYKMYRRHMRNHKPGRMTFTD